MDEGGFESNKKEALETGHFHYVPAQHVRTERAGPLGHLGRCPESEC